MKEKKYFLFNLCILMLFTFYLSPRLAVGAEDQQTLTSISASGGTMESAGIGSGTVSDGKGGFVAKGFKRAFDGGDRQFKWVTENRNAPADKSARGALDGSSYSSPSKDNTFTTTVLANTIQVGQRAEGSTFGVSKAYLSFDTSGIPQDANNISMDVVFYGKRPVINTEGINFYIEVFKSVYAEPLWNSDWGTDIGPPLETPESRINVTLLNFPSDPNASIATIDPNSCRNVIHIKDPLSLINWGGTTRLALVSSRTFEGVQPDGNEFIEIFAPTASKKGLRPALQISYKGSSPQIKPALGWLTGDTYYKDSGAQPDQVNEGTTKVTFRVRYFSAAADGGSGVAPTSAELYLDRSGDGDYNDAGELIPMTPVDASDTDFSDGKDYEAVVDVVSNGSDIRYQFHFMNDTIEAGGTPATVQLLNSIQASKDSKSDSNLCFISSIRW